MPHSNMVAWWSVWKAGLRNLPAPFGAGSPTPSRFPSEPLSVFCELALGADRDADPVSWGFTNVTDLFYVRDGLTITRGRADFASVADPMSLQCTTDNRTGKWSTRNATSEWFGLLRTGSPIRISAEGHVRFTGFVSSLPPRRDLSGRDLSVPLEARGWLYWLGRGDKPARSALQRTILYRQPTYYWALESGLNSSLAFATGGPTLNASSGVVVGSGGSLLGSAGQLAMGPSDFADVPVTMPASPTAWTVVYWVNCLTVSPFVGPPVADLVSVSWQTPSGGSLVTWEVASTSDGAGFDETAVNVFDSAGGISPAAPGTTVTPLMDDNWHMVAVTAEQSGSDVVITLRVDDETDSATATGQTLAPITRLRIGNLTVGSAEDNVSEIDVAHVAIWSSKLGTAVLDELSQATQAYNGEQAHVRAGRLGREEGITVRTGASTSVTMGAQGAKSLLELLRECEASDQAFLFEDLAFGLYFQGHAERFNRPASVALTFTTAGHVAEPFEPTDDDQGAFNDVTVTRDGGASYRVTETDPNVELSIPNIGRRDDSQTYSLGDDDQPQHLAGWRLHMGTDAEMRLPSLSYNLAAAPGLIDDVCSADLAYVVTVDDVPADLSPDQLEVFVEGYSETLGPFDWDIVNNCTPGLPWHVHVVEGDDNTGRVDLDDSTLAAPITDPAAISFTVAVPTILWDTAAPPFDIGISGERMTVTAISGSSSPQTFTVTRSVNGAVKTHLVNAPVHLWQPSVYGF